MRTWMKQNDIMTKLLALCTAILLWFFVMSSVNPDIDVTYTSIPVQLKGVQELTNAGLVIISGADATVSVKLTGKRDRIMNVNRGQIKVTADVSGISVVGDYNMQYTVAIDDRSLLFTRVTETVDIVVDRIISKSIPVKLTLKGALAEGFVANTQSLTPDAVEVKGPERVLSQIAEARIVFDQTGVNASVDTMLPFILVNEKGEEFDMSQITLEDTAVKLTMGVQQKGEVPFTVDVLPTKNITADMLEITFSPAAIAVTGSPEVVSMLNQINLGTISISKLLEDNITELTLPVILPNGVTTSDNTTSVKVTIAFKGLKQKQFELTEEMLPKVEGYTYSPPKLMVTLVGSEESLALVTPEDIILTPTFEPQSLIDGENVVPCTVTVDIAGISVIGKYTVTLVKAVPTV